MSPQRVTSFREEVVAIVGSPFNITLRPWLVLGRFQGATW